MLQCKAQFRPSDAIQTYNWLPAFPQLPSITNWLRCCAQQCSPFRACSIREACNGPALLVHCIGLTATRLFS
jgi:hypothetical protein